MNKLGSKSSTADVLSAFRGYTAGLRDIHKRVRVDLSSDAGTRLAATAAAVGVSATSSRTTGFPLPLTAALRTARGAAQTARFVVYRMTGSPIERGLFIIAMAIAGLAFGISVGTDLGPGNGNSTWKGVLLSASIIVLILGFASLWRPKGRTGRGDRAAATLLAAGCSLAVVALAVALWSRPLTTSQSIAQRHTTIFLIVMLVALSTLVGWLSASRAVMSGRQSVAMLAVGVVILLAVLLGGHRADEKLDGSWLVDHLSVVLGGIAGALLIGAWVMARRAENNW